MTAEHAIDVFMLVGVAGIAAYANRAWIKSKWAQFNAFGRIEQPPSDAETKAMADVMEQASKPHDPPDA